MLKNAPPYLGHFLSNWTKNIPSTFTAYIARFSDATSPTKSKQRAENAPFPSPIGITVLQKRVKQRLYSLLHSTTGTWIIKIVCVEYFTQYVDVYCIWCGTTRFTGLRKGRKILSRNLDISWSESHALILMQYKYKLYLCVPKRYRESVKVSNLAHFFVMLTNRNAADQPCWPIIRMAQNFEMKWLIDKMNMLLNALDIIIHLQHFA